MTGSSLAAVNATLNGVSFFLLLGGYLAVRARRPELHRKLMVAAFVAAALFFLTYAVRWLVTGTVYFPGHGWLKAVYLTILFTHMPLAILVVPLALRALYLALKGRFAAHRRVTRWLYPLWTYVSVTGVIVYLMLYHLPGTSGPLVHLASRGL